MKKPTSTVILVVAIYWGLLASSSTAQTTGSIEGYVKDPSGALVPRVEITITHTETGFTSQVTSDAEGHYLAVELPVGNYSLVAEKQGFKVYTHKNIAVDIAQTVRMDITLALGSPEEVVEVEARPVQVETSTSTLGETVTGRKIVELPLNDRNFLQFAVLQPGATPGLELTHNNTAPTPGGSSNSPQVNGLRGQSNNYVLDGANNNEAFLGEAGYLPPPDALAEFRILTNSFSAQYGRGGGSVISAVTQSGSNKIHGSVYEFLRNDKLDARNFFAQEKSPLRRNQFGFTLGGPIQKDKAFFFASYEGFRESRSVALAATVPSLAERNGDFSALNPDPQSCDEPGAICDPLTGEPFPGNVIPSDRIGEIAQNTLQFYPLPNDPSGKPIHNFQGQSPSRRDNVLIRLDFVISEKQKVMGRYGFLDGEAVTPRASANFGGILALPDFRGLDTFRFQNLALDHTYIFSPNFINSIRLGFNRYSGKAFFADEPAVTIRDLGFVNPVAVDEELAYPQLVIPGLTSLGYATSGPTDRAENTFQIEDNVTYTKGRHTLKFGLQLHRIRHTYLSPQAFGNSVLYSEFATGNSLADFLLDRGLLVLQGAGSSDRDWRSFWTQLYVQDDYRIHRRLTLNLGIRYELKTPYKELRNRRATFQPGTQSVVFPAANEGQLFFGDPGVTDTTVDLQTRDFAPRIGFAWDIFGDGKTSLRGGYGLFFDTTTFFILHQSVVAPPFLSFYLDILPADLTNPFADNPIVTPGSTLAPFVTPYQVTFLEPNWQHPYAQQWNLTFERQLPAELLFRLAYVGTAGRHLPGARNVNRPIFIPGVDPATGEPRTTASNAQSRRPFPGFSPLVQLSTEFNSHYNGLQLALKKPFSSGFSLDVAYTYAKVIDTFSLPGPFRTAVNQTVSIVTTNNDLDLERGRAMFDVTQRLVLNGIWQIPAFQDQVGFLGKLLGGWTLTGIYSARTGFPFSVYDTRNPSCVGFDYGVDRTNLVGDPNSGPRTLAEWFNTDAFVALTPCSPTRGNAGRNIVEGPGFQNFDLGILKTIPVDENARVEFRTELFNAFNHPNFNLPVNDIASPNFGQILSTTPGNEREIQFGLKVIF